MVHPATIGVAAALSIGTLVAVPHAARAFTSPPVRDVLPACRLVLSTPSAPDAVLCLLLTGAAWDVGRYLRTVCTDDRVKLGDILNKVLSTIMDYPRPQDLLDEPFITVSVSILQHAYPCR